MLRVYFMQQWFNLSDPQAEDALYDIEPMRRFVGIELAEDTIPDESTILRFRHLLEEHQLTEKIFAEVRSLLEEKKLLLKSGTIVDATIISAPSSTKNATQERDPEMHQAKKNGQWYFGMKVHVGTSKQGLVHSVATGPAHEADITRLDDLLHGQEEELARPDVAALPRGEVFGRTIAFNVVPLCEQADPGGTGFTTEELKMGDEARKILGIEDLAVAATSVRVPTVAGHGVSIYARFDAAVTVDGARDVLSGAAGVSLVDDLSEDVYPTPLDAAGRDDVLVGRIRQPPGDGNAILLFAVGDNLRKGAALNAVQIAELLTRR